MTHLMRNSIRKRLTITFIGLSILPVLLLGGFLLWQNLEMQLQEAEEMQAKLTKMAAHELQTHIHGLESLLISFTRITRVMEAERKQQRLMISKLLFSANDKYRRDIFHEIVLLDNRGRELAHVSRDRVVADAELGDRSKAEEFAKPSKGREVHYSPVFFDERTGEPRMNLGVPIVDVRSAQVKGVLVAAINLKFMIEVLEDLKIGETGIAYVVAEDGRVVVHPNLSVVLRGTYLKRAERSGIHNGIQGTKSLLAYDTMRVGGQEFRIVTELPIAEAGKYAARSLVAILIFLAATLAGAIAVGVALVRQIISPLESLSGIAKAIGKGDYSQSVTIERDDEIGALSKAFGVMTSRLIETINTLKRQMAELRQADERITQQHDLLKNVMNSLTHPFYVIDAMRHTIVMANTAAHFGELTEQTKCYKMTHHRDSPCEGDDHPCTIREVTNNRRPVVLEHYHHNSTEKPKYYEVYGYPIFDGQGNVAQVIEYTLDITNKKKLEKQFLQAQKMEAVGQLAGGIAHDFNNLLSAIIGYSEMALEELAPNHPAREKIRTINNAGEKAATLTRQLLAFSRKQILELKAVSLNSIVENMTKLLHRVIGEDIHLEINLNPSLENVKADAGQIEQVLMNLAVNARDAMPDGGRLIIETENVELDEEYAKAREGVAPGSYAMLSVTDTGMGMSRDVLENIFEPFFTTKGEKGTGLGLSTIYGIVKQHDGSIGVYSEPNVGTTFKIYIPSTGEAGEDAAPGEFEIRLTGSETILVVDDEPSIRKLIVSTLQPLGFNLLEAGDGVEALESSRSVKGTIDLLITDIIMPEMNGIELAGIIRKERPDILVIYTSGYTNSTILKQEIFDDRTSFLQKPISPKRLMAKLKTVLG
ncbi:MAG: response regulator [Deltaproteobacteria bacterium]|nr:response regulator [Deltaproteobacteria bacterium]